MTYIYRVLKDGPIALYPMDANALTDVSGYNRTGSNVASGYTPTRPIVANGIGAHQFGPTSGARVNYVIPNAMIAGGGKAFSLEAWVKPDVIAGSSAFLARNNSGLFISSTGVLSFVLDMATTLTCKYDELLEAGNIYHIVAVYDTTDAYLYVNGDFVVSIPISDADRKAGFVDAAAMRIHATSGAAFTIDSPAVYPYALSPAAVKAHYALGTAYTNVAEISAKNNANVYRIYDGTANLKSRFEIDTADEWNSGKFTGLLTVVDNELTQQYDTTNSLYYAGTWQYSVFLPQETGLTLSGSRITWDANISNLDVQVSLNGGTSFTAVTNGGSAFDNLSVDSAEQELIIKVTLPAGATAIVVPSITVAVYVTKDIFGNNEDLPLLINDEPNVVVSEYDFNPSMFNNNAGIRLNSLAAGIVVPADPEFGSYYALETVLYADANPAATRTLFVGGTSTITVATNGQWTATNMTAVYINGVSQALGAPFNVDVTKPNHVILVFPAQAGSMYLGNNAAGTAGYPIRVGYLATYRNTLTAANALAIYNAWVGTAATQWKEANKTNIVEHIYPESGAAMRGYAFTWAISGST